jgi:phage repressor protein C with HTH and peptisase S24 domain
MDINSIRRDNLRALSARFPTQAEFAAACGTAPSVISLIVSPNPKRNLGNQLARKIEAAQGLAPGWLDTPQGDAGVRTDPPRKVISNATMIGPFDVWDDDTPLDDDEVYVPFLKEVELSAGSGKTIVEQSHKQKLRFGKLTLRRQGVQPSDAVCVTVSGNSMEPVLPDKSTVGVDQGSTTVVDGKMYALDHDGQLRVKTLYRLAGGGIRMRSFNRDEHPDEEYTSQQMEDCLITIIGRVFWSSALW